MRQTARLDEILRLDPERDHRRIVHLNVCYEFPFDTTRSMELAFFRTFAVPSIARILAPTGEFTQRGQKRYDDTDLIVSAIAEDGYDGPLGRDALRRMNQIHGRFDIANEDFLYVLSTFVFEPLRWNRRFGWRPFVEQEALAAYYFWRETGRRMNIKDIPESFEALERFNVEYERDRFGYTEEGRRVAEAQRDVFLSWFPWLPRAIGARAIYALLDDPLLDALRFPKPRPPVRRAVEAAMRSRGRALRLLPPRRRPRIRTNMRRRTYPRGWWIEELGPPPPGTRAGSR
jgi:hypothetical protein